MDNILTGEWTLSHVERMDNMQNAVNTGLPFLKKADKFKDERISIVGYGPSLNGNVWIPDNCDGQKIIATSGAYDYLFNAMELIADFYVAIDPRESTLDLLKFPAKQTTFLMASVCHPDWWSKLEGFDVKLWHLIDGEKTVDWVKHHHPAGIDSMIGGGSTVAQRAMNVGAALGYRKFEVFGVDCSFTDERHAGPHNGPRQPTIEIPFNGRAFKTTPQLIQSAQELAQFLLTADVEVHFHGDSLMSEIAKTIQQKRKI